MFQKGNKLGGRTKANHTIQAEAYKAFLVQEVLKNKGPLIQALIDKGLAGDVHALKEIHERTMGKVAQEVQNTGKDGMELPTPILINMNVQPHVSHEEDSGSK